jgi:hypothetical protein
MKRLVTHQTLTAVISKLHSAYMDLEALTIHGADPGVVSFAAVEAEFYGRELVDVAERLKAAAQRLSAGAVEATG